MDHAVVPDKSSGGQRVAAVIGGGVIGSGWAARFALMGWRVRVFDPAASASMSLERALEAARRSLPALYNFDLPREGSITLAGSLAEAVSAAEWIQESISEKLPSKLALLKELEQHAAADTIIASSTSGFKPSALRRDAIHPQRIIVCHPFNPVYLLPLVEVVGAGEYTHSVAQTLRSIGMYPLMLNAEIDAHVADRIMEAAWREALWLVHEDIATCEQIDAAIIYGFGIRWAQMGIFATWQLAGGAGGMEHFLKQFGPALKWPWTKLMDVPELTEELVSKISSQCAEQFDTSTAARLDSIRDDNLVAIMRALKQKHWGAGEHLRKHQSTLRRPLARDEHGRWVTAQRVTPTDWADYNGHVNEARYLEAFSDASDEILRILGINPEDQTAGFSYSWFTVENKIRYLHETLPGQPFTILTDITLGEGKKLGLSHSMCLQDGTVLANCDSLLVHVDMMTRRACLPPAEVAEHISRLMAPASTGERE